MLHTTGVTTEAAAAAVCERAMRGRSVHHQCKMLRLLLLLAARARRTLVVRQ